MKNFILGIILSLIPLTTFAVLEPTYAEKVYQDVNHSVFTIIDVNRIDMKKTVAYGSAVAVSSNIIATNCHVALKGEVHLIKVDNKLLPGDLIYKNEADDLCMLRVLGAHFAPVKLRDTKLVKIGEEVFTVASPKGFEKSISRGIVSNEINYKNARILQTDAAISPGSSGGGLFDRESNLVGITFMKDEGAGTEGIGFALPTELIGIVMHQINN